MLIEWFLQTFNNILNDMEPWNMEPNDSQPPRSAPEKKCICRQRKTRLSLWSDETWPQISANIWGKMVHHQYLHHLAGLIDNTWKKTRFPECIKCAHTLMNLGTSWMWTKGKLRARANKWVFLWSLATSTKSVQRSDKQNSNDEIGGSGIYFCLH